MVVAVLAVELVVPEYAVFHVQASVRATVLRLVATTLVLEIVQEHAVMRVLVFVQVQMLVEMDVQETVVLHVVIGEHVVETVQ